MCDDETCVSGICKVISGILYESLADGDEPGSLLRHRRISIHFPSSPCTLIFVCVSVHVCMCRQKPSNCISC